MGRPQVVLLLLIAVFVGALALMLLYRPSSTPPLPDPQGAIVAMNGPGADANIIANINWTLSALSGDTTPLAANVPILTLHNQQMTFTGSTGCNQMSGTYEAAGTELLFHKEIVTTRMACTVQPEIEQKFLQVLQSVRGWKMNGPSLTLTDMSGKDLAQFVAGPQIAPVEVMPNSSPLP